MKTYSTLTTALSISFALMIQINSNAAEPLAAKPAASFFKARVTVDPRMVRAAEIATARAYADSHGYCWRFVKNALLASGVIKSRPTTIFAKQAADELPKKYGFTKLTIANPYRAPVGSVIVYGGDGAGHIEFRTRLGFVSDYFTPRHSARPLLGVFMKY